eukprot:509201-Amphidinium_carterae.1
MVRSRSLIIPVHKPRAHQRATDPFNCSPRKLSFSPSSYSIPSVHRFLTHARSSSLHLATVPAPFSSSPLFLLLPHTEGTRRL